MFPPAEPTAGFPYRIVTKVGEGGMGAVYRAEDLDLGRDVAIKVIKPEHVATLRGPAVQLAVERFLQEARAAAALSHPGVTTVHRIGTEGGWPYIAMEWLDGRTLEELLADEPQRFSRPHAIRIALQVLAVLDVAHLAGVVHRDIKPANLMVIANGRVKVTDFGIARVRGSKLAHTQAGVILGTPHYAAPEQLVGEATDCRVDLYALGSVLYEMIVGHPPFDDATTIFELIHAVHDRAPAPPSALVAGIPPGLDAVIAKALAKRAADRYDSAAEMAAALQPFGSSATAKSSTPAPSTPLPASPPVVVVAGTTSHDLVANAVRRWAPTRLGRQTTRSLLDRVLDRPLHARAFAGALEVGDTILLIDDGIVFAAFEPASGVLGDAAIEAIADEVDATLYALPVEQDPRAIGLLASLLAKPRGANLDAEVVDLAQLGRKLAADGFDGALRLARGSAIGFALYSRGLRILDLFGGEWPNAPTTRRWEEWIGASGAAATIEPVHHAFPSITFRRQLRDLALEVVRPAVESSSLRSDTRATARALQLRPRAGASEELRRGDSTLQTLVVADPVHETARWLLTELAPQFARFGRAGRWKALIEPLARITDVRLHHAPSSDARFDAVTYAGNQVQHVIERVALGTPNAIDGFMRRAVALKAGTPTLGGAILIAPRFEDAAIAAYLDALHRETKRTLVSGLDALTHKEGFVRLGVRSGLHVLLVEETAQERRPLVFE